jgi:NitT/TauT family transport system ATP-binding protein
VESGFTAAQSVDGLANISTRYEPAKAAGLAVSLNDLSFTYNNGLSAVSNVSLDVKAGEILALVGPSGCGKSTLLRIIAGLLPATRGTIDVLLASAGDRPALTMLFQQDTLAPWLTVRQNALLYYRFHPKEAKVVRAAERSADLLKIAGLGDVLGLYPYQLSGGMRRRTAFVAALLPNPHLLLLDEPFSGVDEPTRVSIHQTVHRMLRQVNATAILVTHDLAEAVTLADRVVILSRRPASVVGEFHIDLGQHRDAYRIRKEPAFLELYGLLWERLSAQLASQDQN